MEAHHDICIATDEERLKILLESDSDCHDLGNFMDYPEEDIMNEGDNLLSDAFYSREEIGNLINSGTIPDNVVLFTQAIRKRGNGFPEEEITLAKKYESAIIKWLGEDYLKKYLEKIRTKYY